MSHTLSRLAVAVGFLIKFRHHIAGKAYTLTEDSYAFFTAAFYRMAYIVILPLRSTAGRAFTLSEIGTDGAVHPSVAEILQVITSIHQTAPAFVYPCES